METGYRWRMRIACTNRDTKTGVLLREGDDHHRLRRLLHLHRLLVAVCLAAWQCALVGLQAWRDLSTAAAVEAAPPPAAALALPAGPCPPPPVVPDRGPAPPLPRWRRRVTARGHPRSVRLGLAVRRTPGRLAVIRHRTRGLAAYRWPPPPRWRPWHVRYRRRRWAARSALAA